MERLTKETVGCFGYDLADHKHEIGEFASYDAFYNYSMAVKRLGEYEDTGLTPEEINRIVDAYGRGHTLRSEHSERIEIIREISTDRLRELAQADKDGRLYTTPAKVGDEVYCIFHDKVADKWFIGEPEKIVDVGTKGFFLAVDLRAPDSPDEFHPWDEIGDEFFLTREEAEAALDVVEVKRGEWIYDANGTPRCSECGKEVEPNAISKFCPDCGANLDSE